MKLDYTKSEIEMMDAELVEFVDQILIHYQDIDLINEDWSI